MVARGEGPGALADMAVEMVHVFNVLSHLCVHACTRGKVKSLYQRISFGRG